ncbi:MAG: hypothetical protein AAFP76_07390 [Bacteroidota bacterium]
MKTLVTLLAVGMTSLLGYAQEPGNQGSAVALDKVVVYSLNATYLQGVQDKNTPNEVALLQRKAALYDVRSNKDFSEDHKDETYEMVFKNSKGLIDIFYNSQGKIESAYERFRDVLLPKVIQKQLYQSYKGWTMVGNLYASAYKGDDLIDRSYQIQLRKGEDRKNIVLHYRK